ncbi:periplasmic heavy metal sensor [Litoribacter populi]|uniref:periplasmic heavy metal sensor n=1 Tax=Litoribacter populi TaxID=2598460 RepID=UPI00117BEF47|nr:periplasmic heavy metal sensor [Litoribacter populi]
MKNLIVIAFVCLTGFAQAQDLFQQSLFSADLVMKNREKIKLSEQQAERIKRIHSRNAGEFSNLKWDLGAANEKLKGLLDTEKPDEKAVMSQMDKVLALENDLKKKQLSTLVAIKNELDAEQVKELDGLRKPAAFTYSYGNLKPAKLVEGSPSISISGTAVSGQPTYYIRTDGKMKRVPGIESIGSDNIQSIEVLKDSKAKERFGEEGKNGVVIINLKEENQ